MACTNPEPLPEPSPSAERQVKAAPHRREQIGGNSQQALVTALAQSVSVDPAFCLSVGLQPWGELAGELVCVFSRRCDETVECPELRIC